MLPNMCQHIRARCRLERHSSSNCEAEEVKGEEILQGQEGTFTCSPLQPFTVYSVTISLLPSTILYTRLLRTKEMGMFALNIQMPFTLKVIQSICFPLFLGSELLAARGDLGKGL